jgi:hypothetical protein
MGPKGLLDFVYHSHRKELGWAVNSAFVRVDAWRNMATAVGQKFLLRLPVGPANRNRYLRDETGRILSPYNIREADFRLDTGAEVTFITRSLASDLELEEEPAHGFVLADGTRARVTQAHIRLCIGDLWVRVPCVAAIQSRPDAENLLGMKGLLGQHLFCVSAKELHLFHRAPPNRDSI